MSEGLKGCPFCGIALKKILGCADYWSHPYWDASSRVGEACLLEGVQATSARWTRRPRIDDGAGEVGADNLRWATLAAFNDRDDKAVSDVELAASILIAAGFKLSKQAETGRIAAQSKHAALRPSQPGEGE